MAARGENRLPDWLRTFLVIADVIFLVWAVFTTFDLMFYRVNIRLKERMAAMAMTEKLLILRELNQMTPQKVDLFNHWVPTIEFVPGIPGPITLLRAHDGEFIPMAFVSEFMQLGDGPFLCPIRKYGEGTKERNWAELFTRFAIGQGWAEPSNGPYAARWIDKPLAWKSLGYEVG